jgi:lipopolysaccharide transport system permease protein
MTSASEYTIEPKRRNLLNLSELWEYRELFYFFAWRDVKVKYKQTVLGLLWVVLQPLTSVLIFSLFFGRALNIPSLGLPYPVFVFSGLLLWNLFSTSISSAGNSMISHGPIIKKIYFPRLIIPISTIIVTAVDFLIAFLLFVAMLLFYDVRFSIIDILLFWPLATALTFLGTLGIVCWLSALTVKYRDVRYIIPFGLQIALFLSPVIYPVGIIKIEWVNYILAINPMYAAITIFRLPLVGGELNYPLFLISCASTCFFFIFGTYYFKKTESYFADLA